MRILINISRAHADFGGHSLAYLMGPTTTRVFARVLFLLHRDFLLTKWTLRSRGGSKDIYYFVTCSFSFFFFFADAHLMGHTGERADARARARTHTCPLATLARGGWKLGRKREIETAKERKREREERVQATRGKQEGQERPSRQREKENEGRRRRRMGARGRGTSGGG